MGQLCDSLRSVALFAVTDRQWIQLVAPPIVGLGFFLLVVIFMRGTGDLNRYSWKALLASAGLLTYAGYLTLWQTEIKNAWYVAPFLVIIGLFATLIIPIGLFYWIWRVQIGAKTEGLVSTANPTRSVSVGRKVFRLIVLIWGIANLLGLLAASISAYFRR
jgi:hypothetical protein